jgi:TRAP-type C4-dicarboxylate transport system substrate-binding protein
MKKTLLAALGLAVLAAPAFADPGKSNSLTPRRRTTFHLEAPLGFNTGYVAINNDTYAKLPPAGKAAVEKFSYEPFVERRATADDQMQAIGHDATKAMPGQIIAQLDPKEEARWKEAVAPVTEEWVKATPEGAHVLAAFHAELTAIRGGSK